MSKAKTKSRLPVCVVTKHPQPAKGDKGQLEWTVIKSGKKISKTTEHYCNRQELITSMRTTILALTVWLLDNVDHTPAVDDGQPPTDAV